MILKCPNATVHSLNKFSQFCQAVLPALENIFIYPEAEFKEFEPRLNIQPRFKYAWFHLKLYQMFQDLSRRLILPGFWRI